MNSGLSKRFVDLATVLVVAICAVNSILFSQSLSEGNAQDYWQALSKRSDLSPSQLQWLQGDTAAASKLLTRQWEESTIRDDKTFDSPANELAGLYIAQGSFAQSIDCYERILERDKTNYGQKSEVVARDLNNLGVVLYLFASSAQDKDVAKRFFDEAQFNFNHSIKALRAIGKGKESAAIDTVWINQSFILRDLI